MFKSFIRFIIAVLALIGAVALALVVYVMVKNPFNIRSAILPSIIPSAVTQQATTTESANLSSTKKQSTKNPLLTTEQEKALEKLGIDVAKLPATITPEMEVCFTKKLGETRVDEIKGGNAPNAIDLFKAKSCL